MEKIFIAKDGRKRKGVDLSCPQCGEMFTTRIDQPSKFCSKACGTKFSNKKISLNCSACGKEFERTCSKLKNSKSGYQFCSRSCKDVSQKIGGIKEIMPPHYGTGSTVYRNKFEDCELICKRCGYKEFTCSVDIHHIDENRNNNDIINLIPLCKCCHLALHNKKWKLEELQN